MESRPLDGLTHNPADEVAEHQLCEGFFEDSRRGMGTQILNVQGVFPFAVDGLQLPATMVEFDQFFSRANLRIQNRCKEPTRSEPGDLVWNQPCRDWIGQIGTASTHVLAGMKGHQLIIGTQQL